MPRGIPNDKKDTTAITDDKPEVGAETSAVETAVAESSQVADKDAEIKKLKEDLVKANEPKTGQTKPTETVETTAVATSPTNPAEDKAYAEWNNNVKVIISNNNPQSAYITTINQRRISNSYGSYKTAIPLNQEVTIPVAVYNNLNSETFTKLQENHNKSASMTTSGDQLTGTQSAVSNKTWNIQVLEGQDLLE